MRDNNLTDTWRWKTIRKTTGNFPQKSLSKFRNKKGRGWKRLEPDSRWVRFEPVSAWILSEPVVFSNLQIGQVLARIWSLSSAHQHIIAQTLTLQQKAITEKEETLPTNLRAKHRAVWKQLMSWATATPSPGQRNKPIQKCIKLYQTRRISNTIQISWVDISLSGTS